MTQNTFSVKFIRRKLKVPHWNGQQKCPLRLKPGYWATNQTLISSLS